MSCELDCGIHRMEFKVEIILGPIKVIVQSEFQNAQMVVTQHQYSNQRIIFKYVKINQILLFVLIVGNADFIQINILFEFKFFAKSLRSLHALNDKKIVTVGNRREYQMH